MYASRIGVLICVWSGMVFAVDKPTTLMDSCVTAGMPCRVWKKSPFARAGGTGGLQGLPQAGRSDPAQLQAADGRQRFVPVVPPGTGLKKNTHEPLTTGTCLQCHDPHSSDNKSFLLKATVAQQCAECHDTTQHKKFLHGPVAVGECTVCHNSHSSDYEKLLQVEPTKLCLTCHTITAKELEKFDYIHEPVKGKCACVPRSSRGGQHADGQGQHFEIVPVLPRKDRNHFPDGESQA